MESSILRTNRIFSGSNSAKAFLILSLLTFIALSCGRDSEMHDASGTFESTEIIVSSEVGGKILELNISEGDIVEGGAVVGQIDTVQLFLKKRQLLATVRALEARRPDAPGGRGRAPPAPRASAPPTARLS